MHVFVPSPTLSQEECKPDAYVQDHACLRSFALLLIARKPRKKRICETMQVLQEALRS